MVTNQRRLEFVEELLATVLETLATAQREEPNCPHVGATVTYARRTKFASVAARAADEHRAAARARKREHAEANPCEGECNTFVTAGNTSGAV